MLSPMPSTKLSKSPETTDNAPVLPRRRLHERPAPFCCPLRSCVSLPKIRFCIHPVGVETAQLYPPIYDGENQARSRKTEKQRFTVDRTDPATDWVDNQPSVTPDEPSFRCFAAATVHAPRHVPTAWIEKDKRAFDEGRDGVLSVTFERPKIHGQSTRRHPAGPRSGGDRDRDSLSGAELCRFAPGMCRVPRADGSRGRASGRRLGMHRKMHNTLLVCMAGDNGIGRDRARFSGPIPKVVMEERKRNQEAVTRS